MLNALREENKEGFVDGMLKMPTFGTPEATYWKVCNSMIIQWLVNPINKSIKPNVSYGVSTKTVWHDLKDHFLVGNGLRVHQLKGEIALICQKRTIVVACFTRLKAMRDALMSYTRLPCCMCEGCICGAIGELGRAQDEEKLH